MVKHSNALRRRTKHTHLLPYPDFPLSPHVATRRWYKVIRGRRVYFRPLDDPDAVLERYQRQRFRPCQHPHLTESHFAFRIVVGIAAQVPFDADALYRLVDPKFTGNKMVANWVKHRRWRTVAPWVVACGSGRRQGKHEQQHQRWSKWRNGQGCKPAAHGPQGEQHCPTVSWLGHGPTSPIC